MGSGTTGNSALDTSVLNTGFCGVVRRHLLPHLAGCKIPESLSEVSNKRHASAKMQIDRTSDVSSSFSFREALRTQSRLEHPPNDVPRSRSEAVQNKFKKVSC